MADFVIDSSALVELFTGTAPDQQLRRRAMTQHGTAPELIDIEIAHVVRRMVASDDLPEDVARAALRDMWDTPLARAPHRSSLNRIWQLRHSVTAYDAAYVALAEQLDAPLLTCDGRLARSHGHDARIELYPRS